MAELWIDAVAARLHRLEPRGSQPRRRRPRRRFPKMTLIAAVRTRKCARAIHPAAPFCCEGDDDDRGAT